MSVAGVARIHGAAEAGMPPLGQPRLLAALADVVVVAAGGVRAAS
jgi:hypothetical protein